MKTKKAISPLISWVLLVGFTIAMAALVTNWVIDQTKKFNPEDVVGGSKIYCQDVVLNIEEVSCRGSCENTLYLKLKNKGKFTITKIKGMGIGIGPNSISGFPSGGLVPGGEPIEITLGFIKQESGNEIEIIPAIKVEDKEYYCGESPAVINDMVLANAIIN